MLKLLLPWKLCKSTNPKEHLNTNPPLLTYTTPFFTMNRFSLWLWCFWKILEWELIHIFLHHTGTPYSPPSPPDTSSSATMSPVYPDRPIRPLPKRSLRARLSPKVADTISYPPAPVSSKPISYSPYAEAIAQRDGAVIANTIRKINKTLTRYQDDYRLLENDIDSDDEEMIRRYDGMIAPSARSNINGNGSSRICEPLTHSVTSSNDSVDGYDSFENTNNKKKRKIPTSGSVGGHHPSLSASLSNDLANMGLSSLDSSASQDGNDGGIGHYYGSGSSAIPATATGTGISGAGRGRYGRSGRRETSGRSPLGVSMNGLNAWQNGRIVGPRYSRDYTPTGDLSVKGKQV